MFKHLLFFSAIFLISYSALAQVGSDSSYVRTETLDEITIIGYDTEQKLLETPIAVSVLPSQEIRAYDETSLVPAMNTLPGVRMEQRSPGSYRIAIRGSALRAPFGVRNVKVYWNDIPFTAPSGSTDLNLLDISNFGSVEVIKGPAGSIYGAGTGGVVNIRSLPRQQNGTIAEVGATWGSFGLQRYTASIKQFNEQNRWAVRYAHQQAEGYRNQTAMNRDVLELRGEFDVSDQHTVSTSFLYSDLFYEIPGGLDSAQFAENPRQARQANRFAPGSEEANTRTEHEYVLIGLTNEYRWGDNLKNQTTIYGNFSAFENSFNTNYERDGRQGGGGRTRFYYDHSFGSVEARYVVGAEFQSAMNVVRTFENNMGVAGALRFDDELRSEQAIFFAKADFALPNDFFVTTGLSHNRLNYDIYRLVDNDLDSSYQANVSYDPVWVPHIGISKQITNLITARGSVSLGFSPPTIEEVRTSEGTINRELQPERGVNYELGLRGLVFNNKLQFDVAAFYFQLSETIVQRQSEEITVLFSNAGSTDQAGFELAATWFAIQAPQQTISSLEVQTAYTHHNFAFNEYQKEGEDFSGNDLTGVAPNVWVTTLRLQTRPGFYANLTYNFTDEIPLNDANTVFADAYHLVQGRLGYRKELNSGWQLELFTGADNLLNQKYSLGNDINAFGRRYYQPAATRNYYAGLKIGKR
ncbi:TonB-dependent receptor family protein [Tunicatimonas pelagia]|uniref:TonB-dependent receptor family protein n=1 Tax=Tunicatimonas pelagia TaxID=931531 RepID=UPI00266625F2|nr:TonB-dependent receptor [Tunicatimonas pelagia]WKN42686.1 TonB-dependent receptor plug domain-containing protein [Tunicatimonas pelagia]